jgi:hypothetical protein
VGRPPALARPAEDDEALSNRESERLRQSLDRKFAAPHDLAVLVAPGELDRERRTAAVVPRRDADPQFAAGIALGGFGVNDLHDWESFGSRTSRHWTPFAPKDLFRRPSSASTEGIYFAPRNHVSPFLFNPRCLQQNHATMVRRASVKGCVCRATCPIILHQRRPGVARSLSTRLRKRVKAKHDHQALTACSSRIALMPSFMNSTPNVRARRST